MSANEIAAVTRLYRARILGVLTPAQAATYDGYEQRLQAQINARDMDPLTPTPAEQAVLDTIAVDAQAAALRAVHGVAPH